MNNNPFVSDTYTRIWLKHFNEGAPGMTMALFPDLSFIKNRYFPYYFNTGKTHTKGISYTLQPKGAVVPKNKVFVVYDVPGYFNVDTSQLPENLGLYKVRQYPGFLIELDKFQDYKGYMGATFSKNTRMKMNKFRKRLDGCFEVTYKMYCGEISRDHYDFIFERFRLLLEKRFGDKQISNNNLDPEEWEFYKEISYPMIIGRKAGLFVVYDRELPVGITLNYLSDTTIFDAITVFDIDYTKFHLGAVMLSRLIEWSMDQSLKIFDFSKGYFDYKQRWSSRSYDFEYHIYFDSSSPSAKALALSIKKYYVNKQLLRDKKLNESIHKLTYRLKKKNTSSATTGSCNYTFTPLDNEIPKNTLIQYDKQCLDNAQLKYIVFEFLYLNNECFSDLLIFSGNRDYNYILYGKNMKVGVKMKP